MTARNIDGFTIIFREADEHVNRNRWIIVNAHGRAMVHTIGCRSVAERMLACYAETGDWYPEPTEEALTAATAALVASVAHDRALGRNMD